MEIEYLEEYEDFILPCSNDRLSVERKSVDSLEVLYRDLISESPCPDATANTTNISPYTVKPMVNVDNTSHHNMGDIGFPILKCSTNSASPATHMNAATVSDLQQSLYKSQSSTMPYINRPENKSFSTYSSLQRTDKLKCVATVKPTLQRVINSPKQMHSPPLKNTTVEEPLHSSSLVASTGITESKNKFNVPRSNVIKVKTQFPGPKNDPLSLDENDTFLDFDVEKNGSADDFEFESDLDIPLSDMESDSVDLSDDYSDENFELESDLSSDSSDVKKGAALKKKKTQGSYSKTKPADSSSKPAEQKKDETIAMKNNKHQQQHKSETDHPISPKMGNSEIKSTHPIGEEKKPIPTSYKPQIIAKKESSTTQATPKSKLLSFFDKMPMLIPQVASSATEQEKVDISSCKRSVVAPPSKKETVAKKPNECTTKPVPAITNQEKSCFEKGDTNNTLLNGEKLKDNADSVNTKSKESLFNETAKKVSLDPQSMKTPHSTENTNQKDVSSEKNGRLKLSSLYLKSIKPPASQRLLPKNVSTKPVTSVPKQVEPSKNPTAHSQTANKHPETEVVKEKNIPVKATLETKASAPIIENKTTPNEPKADHPVEQKKYIPRKKSLTKHDDRRLSHKTKGIDESESSDKSKKLPKAQSNWTASSDNRLSNGIVENVKTSDVKTNKPMACNTNNLVEKRLEDVSEESNSLKEVVPKTQRVKNNTMTNGKVSTLRCKFKPRRFNIRLRKTKVEQIIRSSTDLKKSQASQAPPNQLNIPEHKIANKLKRKMSEKPNADVAPAIANSSTAGQDEMTKSQKNVSSELHAPCKKPKITSDISPNISEKTKKTEVKNATSTNKERNSTGKKWKRKKIKLLGPPKVLRSSIKPTTTAPTSQFTNQDAEESNAKEEKRKIENPSKDATNAVDNDQSSGSTPGQVVKVKKRRGRPRSKKTLEKIALANKMKELSQSEAASTEKKDDKDKDETPIQASKVVTEPTENVVPESSQGTKSATSHEDDTIEPKTEPFSETVIFQFHPGSALRSTCTDTTNSSETHRPLLISNESCPHNNELLNTSNSFNTSQDDRNDTGFTVMELPSYIVMKTKIISRRDLQSSKGQIPPNIKQTIKSRESPEGVPVLKAERPDFNDVCLEINSLLGQNANYLKFASSAERQTRINQVLADSSLSVEDAQCTLKFLQSYLSCRTKEVTVKTKSQQFIPIYDSQRKIIGYRKRIIHSRRPPPDRVSNLSDQPAAVRSLDVRTVTGTMTAGQTAEFTTKQEPESIDTGEEETIVPDAEPANKSCIKSEEESSREVLGEV